MGLAEPKNRQRISVDPQNKKWKDDKSAIGFKLLSKMGWSEGKGLGALETGRQTNIKVSLKENNFGIGADARTSDNWLENTFAFDDLLKNMDKQDDTTVFIMPETEKKDSVISSRHSHRKKFLKNKNVTAYDAHQINNILGKTREGDIQRPDDLSIEKQPEQVDALLTLNSELGMNAYFKQKMALKGLSLGNYSTDSFEEKALFGIQEPVRGRGSVSRPVTSNFVKSAETLTTTIVKETEINFINDTKLSEEELDTMVELNLDEQKLLKKAKKAKTKKSKDGSKVSKKEKKKKKEKKHRK